MSNLEQDIERFEQFQKVLEFEGLKRYYETLLEVVDDKELRQFIKREYWNHCSKGINNSEII